MSGVFDELITDRTLEDVQRLTDKGVYCASDMNRVENATAYLAGLMIALPNELRAYAETLGVSWHDNYDVPYNPEDFHLTAKSDWAMEDIPDLEDSERYLGNISALCGVLGCSKEELPKSLDKLFYQDANAIEACLIRASAVFEQLKHNSKRRLARTAAAWPRLGEIFTGEMI